MKRIIVADDTKNIRLLLTKCLELEGFKVDEAVDGEEALEKLKKNKYDLAFLDIKMPLMSGTEVLKKLRQSNIMTPVIIITAYATVKNAVDCTKMGAVAYLQKPFTADKIKLILEQIENRLYEEQDFEALLSNIGNLLEDRNFDQVLQNITGAMFIDPLDPRIYRYMVNICELIGKKECAEKFKKLAELLEKEN